MRVGVTRHAVEQARSRFGAPLLSSADVRADVEAAVAEGRYAIKPPAEFGLEATARTKRTGSRHAWTPTGRVYVVKRSRDRLRDGKKQLIVVTAFAARGDRIVH